MTTIAPVMPCVLHASPSGAATAAIATYLSQNGCNISDSAQFEDADTDRYFMRVSFQPEEGRNLEQLREGFKPIAEKYEANAEFFDEAEKKRVMLMVS